MMNKIKPLFYGVLALSFVLLLSGCDMVLFNPKGAVAAEQIKLIYIAMILMLLIVVPVIIMTIAIAWKYRASNKKATYMPNWAHNTALEVVWWTVPCIIIVILAVITWRTSHSLDPYKPLDSKVKPVTIQAISLDWKWLFIYPDQGIATINYIVVPEKTPLNFQITSQGPMNALWIPALGGQIYAMAGMRTKLHLIADEPGLYDGLSANFSGDGFTGMKFKVKATSQQEFNQWVSEVKAAPNTFNMDDYKQMTLPTEDEPVQYFSHVQADLFNDVMMSFMMPASQDLAPVRK